MSCGSRALLTTQAKDVLAFNNASGYAHVLRLLGGSVVHANLKLRLCKMWCKGPLWGRDMAHPQQGLQQNNKQTYAL